MQTIAADLRQKLHQYVETFAAADEESCPQLIPNREAEAFLADQIPLLECPDEILEQTYYFRWWTFRKHIRQTAHGCVITEFLPQVPWAGPYNTIVCAAGLHIREGRWLKDREGRLAEYIRFWLDGHGDTFAYSSWLPHAVREYCDLKNDNALGLSLLPQMIDFYEAREKKQRRRCGLYWSYDGCDGMEYSLSGPGFRPTLNLYACADAYAIAHFLTLRQDRAAADVYLQKGQALHEKIESLLWDGSFYKTIPAQADCSAVWDTRPPVDARFDVRELIGYIPWYFTMPDMERAKVFRELLDRRCFYSAYGLTTADQSHPRFLEAADHECLWNGYIWPFATSQTLVACANLAHRNSDVFTKEMYYALLRQYARSQRLTREDGCQLPWIDENLNPRNGRWEARAILRRQGWPQALGGRERGKDYNHSLYCDLILSGLLGIRVENGSWSVHPLIPDSWTYFRVENLYLNGRRYCIAYDKDGARYGCGPGLSISEY